MTPGEELAREAARLEAAAFARPLPQVDRYTHARRWADKSRADDREPGVIWQRRSDLLEADTAWLASRPAQIRGNATHCGRGHEFTPDNTYTSGRRRWCKTCKRLRKQEGRRAA